MPNRLCKHKLTGSSCPAEGKMNCKKHKQKCLSSGHTTGTKPVYDFLKRILIHHTSGSEQKAEYERNFGLKRSQSHKGRQIYEKNKSWRVALFFNNTFKGDISIVGLRPVMEVETGNSDGKLPWHAGAWAGPLGVGFRAGKSGQKLQFAWHAEGQRDFISIQHRPLRF